MRSVLLVLVMALIPAALAAQGWIEPRPGVEGHFGVVKVRTAVSVRVSDRVARVEVEERFRNRGGGLGEGDYLYPLPGEAVFSNFSLFQGDQELRGETMDASQARAIYEEIVRRKLDPALIELVGHGLIRARVFPINPGETRKITLRYTQLMPRAGDALHFRYAAGGRYGGTERSVEGASGPRRVTESAPLTFTLTAEEGASFRDPFSPTHEVRVSREGNRLTVRPAGSLDGDFSLFLPLSRGLVGMTLATHSPSGEEGYFMLTLSPGEARGASVPRDLTVVVDVSGSMSGSKMEQARQALRQLLGTLAATDRFRLISFSSGVTAYRPDWTPATAQEIAAARRWVDGLEANGGTNISGALAEAFRARNSDAHLPIVVFLTDGLPSVGEQNPERIAQQAEQSRGRARVFAFGVGYDVNTYLLDRLSGAGRGSTQYVGPEEDVEVALGTLAAKIRHPVLTDLEIAQAPVRLTEVYPAPLPDLFAGEEMVIFGRYQARSAAPQGELLVTGRRNERQERFSVVAAFPEHELANDFIPRLWASRKIGVLAQQIRLNGRNPEVEQEIRETALRYGLLSEYTSYLVQEPLDAPAAPGQAVRLESLTVTGAAAPTSGRAAVRAANRARQQREVRSSAELAAADAVVAAEAGGAGIRTVAGRQFRQVEGVWTDQGHSRTQRVVQIEPFSRAYFELLRLAPELKPYLGSFEQLLVAGQRASIRVAPGGSREMRRAELAEVVREFRGR
ncbi:MAG TPA: VIT domain-containing protein [Longimicrobiaceae bacterium]|nr:VIT domain-containing protein [Longimicrobiaceae bacterium]